MVNPEAIKQPVDVQQLWRIWSYVSLFSAFQTFHVQRVTKIRLSLRLCMFHHYETIFQHCFQYRAAFDAQ